MVTSCEGPKRTIMEEIRPKMVIGVLYLPLEKWSGHLLYQQHIESVEGLSIVTSYHKYSSSFDNIVILYYFIELINDVVL